MSRSHPLTWPGGLSADGGDNMALSYSFLTAGCFFLLFQVGWSIGTRKSWPGLGKHNSHQTSATKQIIRITNVYKSVDFFWRFSSVLQRNLKGSYEKKNFMSLHENLLRGGIVKLLKLWCKFIPIGGFRIGPLDHLDVPIGFHDVVGKHGEKGIWHISIWALILAQWRHVMVIWSFLQKCSSCISQILSEKSKSFSKIRWTMLTIWQESHPYHTSDSFRITPGAGVSSSCALTKLSGPKESQHVWHRSLVQSTDIYSYGQSYTKMFKWIKLYISEHITFMICIEYIYIVYEYIYI